jgi:TetR/AcrR family transcriptional regulator, cholesterol catabolism regulator
MSITPERERTDSKSARLDEILDVAARLFAQRGFAGTTMDDIAKELGILKGSLYYWIDSKEALLTEVLKRSPTLEEIAECEKILARKISSSEHLRLMVHVHINAWIRHPNNFRVFLDYGSQEANRKEPFFSQRRSLENIFKRVLQEGIANGEFKIDEADISITNNSIFGILNWFPRWYRAEGPASPDYIADVMTNLILGGLSSSRRGKQPGL